MKSKEKIGIVFAVILSFFLGIGGTIFVLHFFPIENATVEKTVKNITLTEDNSIKEAISKIYDAVVVVENYQRGSLAGTGTGFVYKKDDQYGYLITNHHVIESAETVKVLNNNGEEVEATVLGSDEFADVAVLRIDAKNVMQVAEIGESANSEVGDTVFTVGSPLGVKYMGTVTKGILSGKDRTIEVTVGSSAYAMEVLQTDAAINPGNSGGPLVNMNGEVIGVNSIKYVETKIESMGFSIPSEIVMAVVERLEKGEKIEHPVIGATLIDVVNPYILYYNRIEIDDSIKEGVVVYNVEDGYPAKEAGLEKGDVILEVNGIKVSNLAYFRAQLYKYSVGDTVTLTINRSGKEQKIEVKLAKQGN